MPNSRLSRSKQKNILITLLQWALMLIGFIALIYLLFINFRPKNKIKVNVPPIEISQGNTTGLDSAKLYLSQTSVNNMIADLIDTMPQNPMNLQMTWQNEKVQGILNLDYQGNQVPANFTAGPSIENNQLILTFESFSISGVPLPVEEAYNMIAGGIVLPDGFYFSPNQPIVSIDVNQLAGLTDPSFVQAQGIDFKTKELILQVFFDPNQDLISIGN